MVTIHQSLNLNTINMTTTLDNFLQRYRDKLLDFNKNSPHLVLSEKTSINVVNVDFISLLNKILDDSEVQIYSLQGDPKSKKRMEDISRIALKDKISLDTNLKMAQGDTQNLKPYTNMFSNVALDRAENLRLKSLEYIKEKGISSPCYIVFGVLLFKDIKQDQTYKAPIISIPVDICKNKISVTNYFSLKNNSSSEIVENKTLKLKLAKEYNLQLPDMPNLEDLGSIEKLNKIKSYLNQVISVTTEYNKLQNEIVFEFEHQAIISVISFYNQRAYEDLDKANFSNLHKNPLINQLISTTPIEPYPEVSYSKLKESYTGTPLVFDADTSQHSAIYQAVEENRNLIVIGPPGSGKSQTICNMIAGFLFKGKKVLFVSEKKTALDVVKQKLTSINPSLSPYLLDLHSPESLNKITFIEDLKKAYDHSKNKKQISSVSNYSFNRWKETLEFLEDKKSFLKNSNINEYVGKISSLYKLLNSIPQSKIEYLNSKLKAEIKTADQALDLYKTVENSVGLESIVKNFFYAKNKYSSYFLHNSNSLWALFSPYKSIRLEENYFKKVTQNINESITKIRLAFKEETMPKLSLKELYAVEEDLINLEIMEAFSQLDSLKLIDYDKFKTVSIDDLCFFSKNYSYLDAYESLKEINYDFLQNFIIDHLGESEPMKFIDSLNFVKILKDVLEFCITNKVEFDIRSNPYKTLQEYYEDLLNKKKIVEFIKVELQAYSKYLSNPEEDTLISKDDLEYLKASLNKGFFSKFFDKRLKYLISELNGTSTLDLQRKVIPRLSKIHSLLDSLIEKDYFSDYSEIEYLVERLSFVNLQSYLDGLNTHIDQIVTVRKMLNSFKNVAVFDKFFKKMHSKNFSQILDTLSSVEIEKFMSFWESNKSLENFEYTEVPQYVSNTRNRLIEINNSFVEKNFTLKKETLELLLNVKNAGSLCSSEVFKKLVRDWSYAECMTFKNSVYIAAKSFNNIQAEFKGLCSLNINSKFEKNTKSLFEGNISSILNSIDMQEINFSTFRLLVDYFNLKSEFFTYNEIFSAIPLFAENIINDPDVEECSLLPCIKYVCLSSYLESFFREDFFNNSNSSKFFNRKNSTHMLENFQTQDKLQVINNSSILAKKIAINLTNLPKGLRGTSAVKSSEFGLLQVLFNQTAPRLSIRAILNNAGKSISILKPCFMMSPKSVAQFLEPDKFEFDVVIMDEASQILPENALGALIRSKQLIIVGDPKQMPPSSFGKAKLVDEDVEDYDEEESILELCQKNFPSVTLKYHYRSQHPSLIAFSNKNFYNNDLTLFPSPVIAGHHIGVHRHYIPDNIYYQRPKGYSVKEAKIVALAIKDHISNVNSNNLSLGVIAFNNTQAQKIRQEFDLLLGEDPVFREEFVKFRRKQPPDSEFFIKSVEYVQGDERDVIFISTTFGPDSLTNKINQRFGIFGQKLGWRRLNVLITRSKRSMHVFTGLKASDIIPKQDGLLHGMTALKEFFNYIETPFLPSKILGGIPDSPFEEDVINVLQQQGYQCISQYGEQGYFIDIVVLSKYSEDTPILAIECDGATYHSSPSARDRDRIRQSILEAVGWENKMHRIWSTFWFKERNEEIQLLLNRLRDLDVPHRKKDPETHPYDIIIQCIAHKEDIPDGTDVDVQNATPEEKLNVFDTYDMVDYGDIVHLKISNIKETVFRKIVIIPDNVESYNYKGLYPTDVSFMKVKTSAIAEHVLDSIQGDTFEFSIDAIKNTGVIEKIEFRKIFK